MSDPVPIPSRCRAWEVSPGVVSTIRIGVLFFCLPLGALTILAGVIGFFLKLPDSVTLVSAGAGLIALGLGAKAWQSQAETPP